MDNFESTRTSQKGPPNLVTKKDLDSLKDTLKVTNSPLYQLGVLLEKYYYLTRASGSSEVIILEHEKSEDEIILSNNIDTLYLEMGTGSGSYRLSGTTGEYGGHPLYFTFNTEDLEEAAKIAVTTIHILERLRNPKKWGYENIQILLKNEEISFLGRKSGKIVPVPEFFQLTKIIKEISPSLRGEIYEYVTTIIGNTYFESSENELI